MGFSSKKNEKSSESFQEGMIYISLKLSVILGKLL